MNRSEVMTFSNIQDIQEFPRAHLKPRLPHLLRTVHSGVSQKTNGNDPSAGSPTETLLRLLLPLNDQV